MRTLEDKGLMKTQAFIDGCFVGSADTPVTDPASGAVIAHVPNLGADAATQAVEAASRAFRPWAAKTAKERSATLRRWFELIVAARSDLATILTSEQGKPFAEALGEIDYAASYVEFYAEEAKRIAGEILPSHRPDARILVQRQPLGVVAAITPWNFPAAMITRKVAPALAAGCTVVVKPAPETPLTALVLAELARRADFPAGSMHLRESTTWRTLIPSAEDSRAHKLGVIERLLAEFPQRRFLLVGDSGEADPEIYAQVFRAHPQRIDGIVIRDVTDENRLSDRYRATFEGIEPVVWHLLRPDTTAWPIQPASR